MSITATSAAVNAFGPLLKTWRSNRKLSQLELSLQAGVSQRHISFLESGRSRPSQSMVRLIAEALNIPLRERNSLMQAAGFAPSYQQRGIDERGMEVVNDALSRTLKHHNPFPAVVIDRHYDLLMQNDSFARMLGLFGDTESLWQQCCPDSPRNLLKLTFSERGARPYIRNFDTIAPHLLARAWHDSLGHNNPLHQQIAQWRKELMQANGEQTLPDTLAPVLPLVLGTDDFEISLFSMIATFGTPHDITTDEIRVETFFPADAATEALFLKLA